MIRRTILAAALFLASPAWAVDGYSAEIGFNDDVFQWRVGAQWKWQKRWFTGGSYELGGYWDVSAGAWYSDEDKTLYDLSVTPVFRYQATGTGTPYLEAAIGFHLLSDLRVESNKTFSTKFQFGDHIGAGVRFGPERRYDLQLRLQHLSNASIEHPNPGINFLQLRFQVHLN
jgi:hypothetical protein